MPGTAVTKSVVATEPGGKKREEIFVDIIERISVTFSSSVSTYWPCCYVSFPLQFFSVAEASGLHLAIALLVSNNAVRFPFPLTAYFDKAPSYNPPRTGGRGYSCLIISDIEFLSLNQVLLWTDSA